MRKILILFLLIPLGLSLSQPEYKLEYSKFSDKIEINHFNHSFADTLFNFVSTKMDFIDFDDCNNCDIRAHLISLILKHRYGSLKLGKVWLFADSKRMTRKENYSKQGYSILSGNSKCFNWGYHVAPFLIIEKDTLVIDPSTQSSVVSVSKWSMDIIPNGFKGFIIIKDFKYYCYPADEYNKFDDLAISWTGVLGESVLEDDHIELAEKITNAYFGFFEPVRFNYYKNRILSLFEE